jgi:hypothetical protein
MDWRCFSSSSVTALQAQHTKFKPSPTKKKKSSRTQKYMLTHDYFSNKCRKIRKYTWTMISFLQVQKQIKLLLTYVHRNARWQLSVAFLCRGKEGNEGGNLTVSVTFYFIWYGVYYPTILSCWTTLLRICPIGLLLSSEVHLLQSTSIYIAQH